MRNLPSSTSENNTLKTTIFNKIKIFIKTIGPEIDKILSLGLTTELSSNNKMSKVQIIETTHRKDGFERITCPNCGDILEGNYCCCCGK